MGGNERLTLEIATKAIGQESIDRLSESLNRFSAASESAGSGAGRGAGGLRQMGEASEAATPSIRRLFLAVKDLGEGRTSFATVEAGYFILSLGGIATAAGFAAVGIAALAYGISKMHQAVSEGGPKMARAFDGLNGSIREANDELRVTGDRLRNEIAALEGKPQNTLALALDEARLAADKLAGSIGKDIDALNELMKKQGVGIFNGIFTNRTSTGYDQDEITKFGERLGSVDRAGISSVRGAKTEEGRASAQVEWNKRALAVIDAESDKFGRMVAESEGLDARHKQDLTNPIHRIQNMLPFDSVLRQGMTVPDESGRLEERRDVLGNINEIRDKYSLTTGNDNASAKKTKLQADKELQESAKTERTKEQEMLRSGMAETLGQLKQSHELVIGEETAFWTKRLDEVKRFGGRYTALQKEINVTLGTLRQEAGRTNARVATELGTLGTEGWDGITKEVEAGEKARGTSIIKSGEQAGKVMDLTSTGKADTAVSALNQRRLEVQRAASTLPAGSSESQIVNARIVESQKLMEIDRAEAKARIAGEAGILARMYADYEDDTEAYQQHKNKITEISTAANQKIYDDQTKMMEAVRNEQEKDIQGLRGLAGGLYDAATSHSPNAIPNFVKSQVLGVGKTVSENVAEQYLLKPLQKLIPTSPGGALGAILKGTGLTKDDPLKTTAAPALVGAAGALTAAARALAASRAGIPGGGGGGWTPSGNIGSGTDAYGNPIGAGMSNDGLPISGGGMNAGLASSAGLSGSGFGFNASTIGSIAAMGGAAAVAAKDFSTGGVGKDLQGAGAVAGIAATAIPMITKALAIASPLMNAIPIVGAIAAAALPLIGSFIDAPQRRASAINTELGQAQYIAPQALNATQSSSGDFTDFDARGNIRTSDFSAIPQVRQGSVWEQTHGLFGGPPSFYNVPGGQTSQFGAANGGSTAPATVIVNHNYGPSMDAQSFHDFAQKNSYAIGNAAAKSMQDVHGALSTEVDRRTS